MDTQEEIFNDSKKLLFLPVKEPSNLASALEQLPGLRKLAQEYYALVQQKELSEADAERMSEIFELAIYDELLDECIEKIDESVEIIKQLDDDFSLEEFIDRVENIPVREMTPEKFKELAQRFKLNDRFLNKHISFQDNDYHRKLIFSAPFGCVYVISWKTGQKTGIHCHTDSFSVIHVYQGTLTHRLLDEVNHLHGQKGYRPIQETQVKENQWICIDLLQNHQLINESMENLVTLHFRYFKNPIDEFSLPGCNGTETKEIIAKK
jgi:mannose-6-phosphate isomerase-like protein (cupin superfamily)